jgi:hypothetical protein
MSNPYTPQNFTTPVKGSQSVVPGAPTKSYSSSRPDSNDESMSRLLEAAQSRYPSPPATRPSLTGRSASAYVPSSTASAYNTPVRDLSASYGQPNSSSRGAGMSQVSREASASSQRGQPSPYQSYSAKSSSAQPYSAGASQKMQSSSSYASAASERLSNASASTSKRSSRDLTAQSRFAESESSDSESEDEKPEPLEEKSDSDDEPKDFINGLRSSQESKSVDPSAKDRSILSELAPSKMSATPAITPYAPSNKSVAMSQSASSKMPNHFSASAKAPSMSQKNASLSARAPSIMENYENSKRSSASVMDEKKSLSSSLSKMSTRDVDHLAKEKESLNKLGLGVRSVRCIAGENKCLIEVVTPLMNKALVLVNTKPDVVVYESHGEKLISTTEKHMDELADKWAPETVGPVGVYYQHMGKVITIAKVAGEFIRHYYKLQTDRHCEDCHPLPIVDYDVFVDVEGIRDNIDACAHNLLYCEKNYVSSKLQEAFSSSMDFVNGYVQNLRSSLQKLDEKLQLMIEVYDRMRRVEALETDAETALAVRAQIYSLMDAMKELAHVRHRYEAIQRDVDAIVAKIN